MWARVAYIKSEMLKVLKRRQFVFDKQENQLWSVFFFFFSNLMWLRCCWNEQTRNNRSCLSNRWWVRNRDGDKMWKKHTKTINETIETILGFFLQSSVNVYTMLNAHTHETFRLMIGWIGFHCICHSVLIRIFGLVSSMVIVNDQNAYRWSIPNIY